jgi:hypothetical protein
MNIRICAIALAVLAVPALAQTPQSSSSAMKDMQQQKKDPMMMQESAPPTWDMIQGHEKGYVSMRELTKNSWLSTNFKACDKDSDGKVTQSEYAACEKMPKQPE